MNRRNAKIYGNDNTALTLTRASEKFYNDTYPIRIWEYETGYEDIPYVYDVDIAGDLRTGLDSKEVNEFLEYLYAENCVSNWFWNADADYIKDFCIADAESELANLRAEDPDFPKSFGAYSFYDLVLSLC